MEKIGKKTLVSSYLALILQYGVAILILPVMLNMLPSKEVGIWYIFISVSSLVSLVDFGFSPSIQRSAAYVSSGASELKEDGYVMSNNCEINFSLLASLIKTSQFIYKKISLVIILLGVTAGSFYMYLTLKDDFTVNNVITWIIYVFCIGLNFHFNYLLSLLRGLGYIGDYNMNVIISKVLYIVTLYILIFMGLGLLSLVFASIVNTMVMIILAHIVLNKKVNRFSNLTREYKTYSLFRLLWKNAKNSGLVSLGVFLLSQSGVFLSGIFLGLEEVASLGLCVQIFTILVVSARVYFTTYTPYISSLWVRGSIEEVKKVFYRCQLISYSIYFLGFTVIYYSGDYLLENLVHSNVMLPSSVVIALYGLFNLMEITHGNCCMLIATSNNIPFTKASLISGLISVVATIGFSLCGLGMVAFPLGLCCGSLPYNFWKWPYETYKILNS